jgi:hypothetical protein
VSGIDPRTGHELVGDQRSVNASQLIQNTEVTLFVDSEGEVLEEWPTELILKTEWEKSQPESPSFWSVFRANRLEHHPRAWRRWTEDQDLKNQYDNGLSIVEIAALHERSASAVTAHLLNIGRVHWNSSTDS